MFMMRRLIHILNVIYRDAINVFGKNRFGVASIAYFYEVKSDHQEVDSS